MLQLCFVVGKVAAAVGDGGNDVSMIQAASVGIGIVGKEGMQASLASDFSMTKFSQVLKYNHFLLSYDILEFYRWGNVRMAERKEETPFIIS